MCPGEARGRRSVLLITVYDCFFVTTRDEDWVNEEAEMLKRAFEELTLDRGEVINTLGMTVHMERDKGRAVVNQKRFLEKLCDEFKVKKTAVTPATADLLRQNPDSKLLDNQRDFMSLNATFVGFRPLQ